MKIKDNTGITKVKIIKQIKIDKIQDGSRVIVATKESKSNNLKHQKEKKYNKINHGLTVLSNIGTKWKDNSNTMIKNKQPKQGIILKPPFKGKRYITKGNRINAYYNKKYLINYIFEISKKKCI